MWNLKSINSYCFDQHRKYQISKPLELSHVSKLQKRALYDHVVIITSPFIYLVSKNYT